MSRATECSNPLLILSLIVVGCAGTQETRFLTCRTRPPAVEAKSYDIHDPFADEDVGPSMFSRPRTFTRPRTDTRKDFDLRYLNAAYGFPQQRASVWNPATQSAAVLYPVQPIWQTSQPMYPLAASAGWAP